MVTGKPTYEVLSKAINDTLKKLKKKSSVKVVTKAPAPKVARPAPKVAHKVTVKVSTKVKAHPKGIKVSPKARVAKAAAKPTRQRA